MRIASCDPYGDQTRCCQLGRGSYGDRWKDLWQKCTFCNVDLAGGSALCKWTASVSLRIVWERERERAELDGV